MNQYDEPAVKIDPVCSKEISHEQESSFPLRENTGRWDENEHKQFLEGLQKFGNDWKQIASMISTRNLVQVRTHAQKYFQKIAKNNSTKSSYSDCRKRPKECAKIKTKEVVDKTVSEISSPVSTLFSDSSSSSQLTVSRVDYNVLKRDIRVEKVVPANPLTVVLPRSPMLDFNLYDTDLIVTDYHRNPYHLSSPFDIECNNNLDDMECFDCSDLLTPVFN